MKKMMIMMGVAAAAVGVFAGPCGGGGCGGGRGGGRGCGGGGGGGGCRPCRPVCRPCRPCRPCGPGWGCRPCGGDWWGRGGRNFWPGFIGGVVGGIACNAVATPCYRETVVVQSAPTVVTQPVVVQQPVVQSVVTQPTQVWVEGRYVDQVQANGSVVRVWQPGHYE